MKALCNLGCKLISVLNWFGTFLPQLGLRFLLAKEFWDSGVEKYNGVNWFADIQDKFPFPFNQLPVNFSWGLSTWTELIGAVLLVFGLATRFATVSLIIVTIVAIVSVHWPDQWHGLSELLQGYTISDHGHGNYKLPLIYLIMFMPLLLQGPGRASLDHLIAKRFCRS